MALVVWRRQMIREVDLNDIAKPNAKPDYLPTDRRSYTSAVNAPTRQGNRQALGKAAEGP
jgi:hypothetical protein